MNTQKLFNQFMNRPMRSNPEDLQEQIMQPDWIRKMSKRDKARHEFVMKYRHRLTVDNSVRHTVEQHLEWLEDAKEGRAHLRDMKYAQLVEEINKDQQLLQYVEKPLMLYKDEKAALAEVERE